MEPKNQPKTKQIVGMWECKKVDGSNMVTIIHKTPNKNIYLENTNGKETKINKLGNLLNITYESKIYEGLYLGNRILWKNKVSKHKSKWHKVNWILGAENLKGNYINKSSLMGLEEVEGIIIGIGGTDSQPVFTILKNNNSIIRKINLEFKLRQTIKQPNINYPSKLCKYM